MVFARPSTWILGQSDHPATPPVVTSGTLFGAPGDRAPLSAGTSRWRRCIAKADARYSATFRGHESSTTVTVTLRVDQRYAPFITSAFAASPTLLPWAWIWQLDKNADIVHIDKGNRPDAGSAPALPPPLELTSPIQTTATWGVGNIAALSPI